MSGSIDETICPLCGKNNACQNSVTDQSIRKSCWCQNSEYEFPVDLLTRIPAKFKGKACICETCAQTYRKRIL